MGKPLSPRAKIIAVVMFAGMLPSLVSVAADILGGDALFVQESLHESLELTGSCIALGVATLLLVRQGHDRTSLHLLWVAAALVAMGLVDGLHAVEGIAERTWMRPGAWLLGGVLFGCVWLRFPAFLARRQSAFLPFVAALAMALGFWWNPDWIVHLAYLGGSFVVPVEANGAVGGLGFLASAVYFCRRYLREPRTEDLVFAGNTTLFAVSGLMIGFAHTWGADWWFWHAARLLAYAVLLIAANEMIAALQQQARLHSQDLENRVEQRTAELKNAYDRTSEILESITDAFVSFDREFRFTYVNREAEKALRRPRQELLGKIAWDAFPLASGLRFRYECELALTENRTAYFEEYYPPYDRWYSVHAYPSSAGLSVYLRDVSESKHAESLVHAANTLLRLLPEKLSRGDYMAAVVDLLRDWTGCHSVGIRGIDEQGRIPYEAYAGFTQDFWNRENELIVHHDRCVCTRLILGSMAPPDAPAMTPGGSFACGRLTEFAQGLSEEDAAHYRSVCIQAGFQSMALVPLRHQEQTLGIIHLADQTPDKLPPKMVQFVESLAPLVASAIQRLNLEEALRRTAEELRQAKAAADAANVAKGRFLANMSHELRTPMNAILGMIDVALPKAADPTLHDCLATAKGSADLLLTLLNDLLDTAKIEAGKLELASAPFSLRRMLDQATRALAVRASEKGLVFACRVDEETPDALVGDRMRLQQIVLNLAGNAIKFTESGDVEVRVRAVSQNGAATLEFAVHDTGIGIPPADQTRLFEPFTQADASISRRFGGTGLGLGICKSLVELMGGTIRVESEVGSGSTFYFTVRLPVAAEPLDDLDAPVALPAAPPAPLRILLAEDNHANQKLVSYILQGRGHVVDNARDGHEAIQISAQYRYDAILMDVQMPGMSGLDATAAIRKREDGSGRVPIIAMTAHAMQGDRERCLDAGMDAYLSKPIDGRRLILLVETMAGSPPGGGAIATPPDPACIPTPGPASTAPQPDVPVFHPDEAIQLCFHSREMARQMIEHFFQETEKLFPQIHAALESGDLARIGGLVHRLKGTVVFLGARLAVEAADRVEQSALSGDDHAVAETAQAVAELQRQCERLSEALITHPLAAAP